MIVQTNLCSTTKNVQLAYNDAQCRLVLNVNYSVKPLLYILMLLSNVTSSEFRYFEEQIGVRYLAQRSLQVRLRILGIEPPVDSIWESSTLAFTLSFPSPPCILYSVEHHTNIILCSWDLLEDKCCLKRTLCTTLYFQYSVCLFELFTLLNSTF